MSDFAWWYYSLNFTHSYRFQWPWLYFTAASNSFSYKLYLLIRLSWNFVQLLITLCRQPLRWSWTLTTSRSLHLQMTVTPSQTGTMNCVLCWHLGSQLLLLLSCPQFKNIHVEHRLLHRLWTSLHHWLHPCPSLDAFNVWQKRTTERYDNRTTSSIVREWYWTGIAFLTDAYFFQLNVRIL